MLAAVKMTFPNGKSGFRTACPGEMKPAHLPEDSGGHAGFEIIGGFVRLFSFA